MLVAVALICLPLITLALRAWLGAIGWRETLLSASALWAVYLTAVTELLSLAHAITTGWLFACWLALALALEAYLFWRVWRNGWRDPVFTGAAWRRLWARLTWPLWALLGGVGAIMTLTLVTALAAPPNTPDSVVYHLTRVMRWIEDASLALFPSHEISQVIQPPWAEYTFLNLHLLSGSDHLDGLVQWGCFVGSAIGVSLIAARLGASVRGQVYAAFFAATIPMAVIQAASTQNDLAVAFWLVCVVYFLLDFRAAGDTRARVLAAALAGLSLGLAALTKGLAYVDALPFLLVFGLWAIVALRWRAWLPFVALGALALALNLGFYARNVIAFGSPLGPSSATRAFSNASYTPDVLALNIVRNLAVEFGSPDHALNVRISYLTDSFLQKVGLDPNDARATMAGSPPFHLHGANGFWLSDGYTTNTAHLLIALLAVVACLALPALRRREIMGYVAALVGAFGVFSLYVAWQAGSNRIMLGLFVLAAPLAGVALEALAQRARRFGGFASAALLTVLLAPLFLSAAPRVVYAQSRPLLGAGSVLTTSRVDQYFAAYPPAERPYVDGVNALKATGCHQIGYLVSGPQDRSGYTTGAPAWEYQLWALLGEPAGGSYQIEDVLVTNQTAPLASEQPYASFQPCAVFAILQPDALQRTLTVAGRGFHLAWDESGFSTSSVAVYVLESAAASRWPNASALTQP